MKYVISEDQSGHVTLSEVDPSTRRVVRSARFEASRCEHLLTWLSQQLPVQSFARRRKSAAALVARTSLDLFSALSGSAPPMGTSVGDCEPSSVQGQSRPCEIVPARRSFTARRLTH